MRSRLKTGFVIGLRRENFGATLSFVSKLPCTWQARMRSSSITGVLLASDSSKPFSTMRTMEGRFGRGSSSQTCDFCAKAWLRSWMMEAPSP
jgi:hypothetical protein